MASKWLAQLKEIAPAVTRVAVLLHPDAVAHEHYWRALVAAAPLLEPGCQEDATRGCPALGVIVRGAARASADCKICRVPLQSDKPCIRLRPPSERLGISGRCFGSEAAVCGGTTLRWFRGRFRDSCKRSVGCATGFSRRDNVWRPRSACCSGSPTQDTDSLSNSRICRWWRIGELRNELLQGLRRSR